MKTVKELRNLIDFNIEEVTSSVKYFINNNIDWDVYLPSIGKNLQRGFVWTLKQKRELIWSVLIGRHIPHVAMINVINNDGKDKDIWLVIDGKQRLSTIFDFVKNLFTLEIDGVEYLFSELPSDYHLAINNFYFRYYVVNEPWDKRITDQQKINWFKYINYSGTPQDEEHIKNLG